MNHLMELEHCESVHYAERKNERRRSNSILLLGGTGAMGKHLAVLLSQNPENNVYITSRRVYKSQGNITYITGNALDDSFIIPLLKERKWTAIIDFMIYSTEQFKSKVKMLLSQTEQYVFLSSSRVYDNSKTPITENSNRLLDSCEDHTYLRTDEYALTKARQENILKVSGKQNWTIIRPYITFSEIRLQLGVYEKENWLYRALQGRTIVFSKDILQKRTTLTYGYDVARGIVALIGNKKAFGEAFHITISESHTWGEILDTYIDILEKYTGKKPKVLLLDNHPYQHKDKPFYQLVYDRHFNRIFDNTKIRDFIDTDSFTPTLDGLKICLNSFLYKQNFRAINWRGEAGRDRLTGECARLKEFHNIKTMTKYYIQRFLLPKSYL